jgi:hypothetical protein
VNSSQNSASNASAAVPANLCMPKLFRRLAEQLFIVLSISMAPSCSLTNYATNLIERDGNTIRVKRGGDLQSAVDRSKPGDTITLEAGATFKVALKLPNKGGGEFVTIRTAASDIELPPEGRRLDPTEYGRRLPKIESNIKGEPAISTAPGAHHYRFVAIEFGPTVDGLNNIIQIGSGDERRIEDLPHHIEFDRVYIHGSPTFGQRRGIAANGKFVSIKNSHISDIKQKGDESQAIAAWATDGPIEIVNNYLEAGAENILFGGAGSPLKLVPSDCVVLDNHLNKPVEWREDKWVVKNLFEIKNGRRIKVQNNLMTNNWGMAQDGFAVLFTTRADNGPATTIEDIEFEGNIVRGSACGVSIFGGEGSKGHRLKIRNNQFVDIDGKRWGGVGLFMKSSDWDTLTIENNTILQSGSITTAYGKPITNFVFRNNIIFQGPYGFKGDNMDSGVRSAETYFPGGHIINNIIIGGDASLYKERNFYPSSIIQLGFVDVAGMDYRFREGSPYLHKGLGSDVDVRRVGVK